ncbi:hypothetical protein F5Y18DRAFT_403605 [Xylariaceae sp. FL1019]|nr:hypothetical protein F5Y18DRAFT_403605 [Xylariaceae sp. FL1019]
MEGAFWADEAKNLNPAAKELREEKGDELGVVLKTLIREKYRQTLHHYFVSGKYDYRCITEKKKVVGFSFSSTRDKKQYELDGETLKAYEEGRQKGLDLKNNPVAKEKVLEKRGTQNEDYWKKLFFFNWYHKNDIIIDDMKTRSTLTKDDKFRVLNLLAIDPKHQGDGNGQILVDGNKAMAHQVGLPLYVSSATGAREFYERQRFKRLDNPDEAGRAEEPEPYFVWYPPKTAT